MQTTRFIAALLLVVCAAADLHAQDPPPPIGPYVVDVRLTFPKFSDDAAVAASRGVAQSDLPGRALGLDFNAHVYPFRWKVVTFGLGGQLSMARATSSADTAEEESITEKMTLFGPQLSLNFGSGKGWSYLSGGVGFVKWSIVPDGRTSLPADDERLNSFNYGGGARWFTRRHVAFHFDLRFYEIGGGSPGLVLPASPRSQLFVLGAGVSLK